MKNLAALFFCLLASAKPSFSQPDSALRFLPLQVSAFDAAVLDKNVRLSWSVNNNEEARSFEVERAEGGGAYAKVGSRLAANKPGTTAYDFVDALPKPNVNFSYRIKVLAKEGPDVYSAVQNSRVGNHRWQAKLKQNPVRTSLEVEAVSAAAAAVTATVFTAYGQKVFAETAKLAAGKNLLSFSAQNLAPGLYRLALESGGQRALLSFVKE